MATDLYLISNIKTTKEEVIANKDIYLQKLKGLKLEPTSTFREGKYTQREGDWEYEFPYNYDEVLDKIIPDEDATELVYYSSPFVFSIRVYENCLELTTIYKYRFLYEDEYRDTDFAKENLLEFRRNIFDIVSIFGGTEIIYLADNASDKLSDYLELWAWEGRSYDEIKQDMIARKLPFRSDYENLKLNDLRYRNTTEIIFDDFKDLKV
ncbi:MAG TPA: hypothetical protein PLB11_04250 [Flavobacterium sp.]|nr:hypothetical protein [Flavobacterium sp.]